MIDRGMWLAGILKPDETEIIQPLFHVIPKPEFFIPSITNKQFIQEFICQVIENIFEEFIISGNVREYLDNDEMETLDCILEIEDSDSYQLFADEAIKRATDFFQLEEIQYLKNSDWELDRVTHRFEDTEGYVRWYVVLRRDNEADQC